MAYHGPDWSRLRQMEYDKYQAALLVLQEQQYRNDIAQRIRNQARQHRHRQEFRLLEATLSTYKFLKAHPELWDLLIDASRLLSHAHWAAEGFGSHAPVHYAAQVFHLPTVTVRCGNCLHHNKVLKTDVGERPGPVCVGCHREMRIAPRQG